MKASANDPSLRKQRCAIYTRTSSDERLGQEFNSLDAQREACEAYIRSQRHEGWLLSPNHYDDGGHSGGSTDRPALKQLLADIEDGRIDVVVAYKIDRLSRSMRDFMTLVDLFDRHGVTCVSITQNFNTTTSMGRLTLNMLLSFAQFEREQGRERICDKIAASRARGIFMGGMLPLGYRVENRKLLVVEAEAQTVRMIFRRFVKEGSATVLARALAAEGVLTKTGKPMNKGALYQILNNRTYLGLAVHKGKAYPGEHKAIIDQALWDKVHAVLAVSPRTRANETRATVPALLKGLLYTSAGHAMSPTHTRKDGKLYRYYTSQAVLKNGAGACTIGRLSAADIEGVVLAEVRKILRAPEILAGTWLKARGKLASITEAEVRQTLIDFEALWDQLFPAEQHRIVQLLVERVEVAIDSVSIRMRHEGLGRFAWELCHRQEAA